MAGGIQYKKSNPTDMLLKNLQMITNVMDFSCKNGCKKMINVCSALLYPKEASIPLKEEDATYTNLGEVDTPYALAKAVGMQLARYYNQQYGMHFLTVVPCNFLVSMHLSREKEPESFLHLLLVFITQRLTILLVWKYGGQGMHVVNF